VQNVFENPAPWLAGHGPHEDVVLGCLGYLSRNLAEFPFPERCDDEERRTIEDRVRQAASQTHLFRDAQYLAADDFPPYGVRFLAERRLVIDKAPTLMQGGGVLVTRDFSAALHINAQDHICVCAMAPGLQPQELWALLDRVDSELSTELDFAFNKRHGYLTASLGLAGTGLRLMAVLHLAGLIATQQFVDIERQVRERRHTVDRPWDAAQNGRDGICCLSNAATLGSSEQGLAFEVAQLASEVATRERAARGRMTEDATRRVADRVGRALALARGARLLDCEDALDMVSSVRLGLALGLLEGDDMQSLNSLLVEAQPGHIQAGADQPCDDLTLSMLRADLFNARFQRGPTVKSPTKYSNRC